MSHLVAQDHSILQLEPSETRLSAFFAEIVLFMSLLLGGCSVPQHPEQLPESVAITGPEVEIPKEFYGCWENTPIEQFDSITPLTFGARLFLSKSDAAGTTWEFCVRPKADGKGAELKLTKVKIRGKAGTVTYFKNRVTAVDPEHKTAHLRNHGTVEGVAYVLWLFPVHIQQDIFAEEDVELKVPDLIFMQAKELLQANGTMLAEVTFHTDFHRVPEESYASGEKGGFTARSPAHALIHPQGGAVDHRISRGRTSGALNCGRDMKSDCTGMSTAASKPSPRSGGVA